jgi:hypothetical protein
VVGGLGVGGLAPHPQPPIPNPQSPIPIKLFINYYLVNFKKILKKLSIKK